MAAVRRIALGLAVAAAGWAHLAPATPASARAGADAIPLPGVAAQLSIVPVPGEPGRLVASEPCFPLDCTLGVAYASDDGGRSWAVLGDGPAGALWTTRGVARVIWSSQREARPMRSADGGRTWLAAGRRPLDVVVPLGARRALATPDDAGGLSTPSDFWFCDRLPPYATAARRLLRTDDGGRTWRTAIEPQPGRIVEAVAAGDGPRPVIVAALGTLRKVGGPCRLSLLGARIWSSSDGGRSWRRVGDVPGAVGALAVDGSRILVGTSDGAVRELRGRRAPRLLARLGGPVSQVVRRTDGDLLVRAGGRLRLLDAVGSALPPPAGLPRWADAVALAGDTGIASAGGGAVRTADGGRTFTADVALPAEPGAFGGLALAGPGHPATGGPAGLRVLDGATWQDAGPGGTWIAPVASAPTPGGHRLYARATRLAAVVPFGDRRIALASALVATDDAGATWHTVLLPRGARDVVAIDATDADRIVTWSPTRGGTVRHLLSEDGGGTWRAVAIPAIRGFPTFVAIRGEVLVASLVDGTVRRSDDGGRTWRQRSVPSCPGISARPVALVRVGGTVETVADCAWLSVQPRADGDRVVAVDLDGRARSSADGGATWSPLAAGDVVELVPDPAGGAWAATRQGLDGPARLVHVDVP